MILIPTINPIRFSLSGTNEPKVEYAFYRDYYQKFQRTDSTKIQILIPGDEPQKNWTLSAVKIDDEAFSYTATSKTFGNLINNYLIAEYNIDFSFFDEGKYRFFLRSASGFTYRSDVICVKNHHEHTRLLSYRNAYNEQGVAFSSGIVFHLRVEAQLYKAIIPKSEDSIYTDNLGGYRTLTSSPYSNYRLNIGGTRGIPDWLMNIINQAFSCDTLFLNSVEITKADGATFEAVEQENYNLRSWNIEIGHIENNLFYEERLLTVNGEQQLMLNVQREAQSVPVIVFATSEWEMIGALPEWLTIVPVQGGSNGVNVMITLSENVNIVNREVIVFFRLKDRPSIIAELNIVQGAAIAPGATWSGFVNVLEQVDHEFTATWTDHVNVLKKTCRNAYSHAYSRAYNCTSPEAP